MYGVSMIRTPRGSPAVTEKTVAKSPRKRVTLADVAAQAGVSVATASVAITGRPSGNCRVSPQVAEKIRSAARALNYRPNIHARSLSTRRTNTVAMLIKRASWHNAMYYVSAMQRVLRERGYSETFLLHPDNRLDSEQQSLETCIERHVEGIISIPVIDLEHRANVELYNQVRQEEQIPVVHLGIALPGAVAPAMTTDDIEGIRAGVRLLHAMGHRRIAHVTIPGYDDHDPLNPFKQAHLRYLGYHKAIEELGLAEQVFCTRGRWTEIESLYERGAELARPVLAASPKPTAVVAFVDYMAAGLITGLRGEGVSVPEQMSVLGFGDQSFCRMICPALTTLVPQFERLGELATQTLLDMIDGKPGESAMLAPSLIERESIRAITPDD